VRGDARFEQLVQQGGIASDLRGDIGTALAKPDQPAGGKQVFVEQRYVRAAAEDPADYRQCPLQSELWLVALHHQREQAWHEALQPFLRDRVDLQRRRRMPEGRN